MLEQLGRRPEDPEPHRPGADGIAGPDPNGPGTSGLGLGSQTTAEARVEQPSDWEMLLEQFLNAAGMVGLFVGDDGDTERIDAGLIEGGEEIIPGRAPVDQDRRRCRRLEKDRIALADVEHLDAQAGTRRTR